MWSCCFHSRWITETRNAIWIYIYVTESFLFYGMVCSLLDSSLDYMNWNIFPEEISRFFITLLSSIHNSFMFPPSASLLFYKIHVEPLNILEFVLLLSTRSTASIWNPALFSTLILLKETFFRLWMLSTEQAHSWALVQKMSSFKIRNKLKTLYSFPNFKTSSYYFSSQLLLSAAPGIDPTQRIGSQVCVHWMRMCLTSL